MAEFDESEYEDVTLSDKQRQQVRDFIRREREAGRVIPRLPYKKRETNVGALLLLAFVIFGGKS